MDDALICYLAGRLAADEAGLRRAAIAVTEARYGDDDASFTLEVVEAFLEPLRPDTPADRRNYDGGARRDDARAVAAVLSVPDVRREQERLSG